MKYNLSLPDIAYLLQLRNYINNIQNIYVLSQEYSKKYNNVEAKKDSGGDYLKMKTWIERNLEKLNYINIANNKTSLTHDGRELIDKINCEINWTLLEKLKLLISKYSRIAKILSLFTPFIKY